MLLKQVSVLLLFVVFSFQVQAQENDSEKKASQMAEVITKYINAKLTDEAQHVTAAQTGEIKQAYLDFYSDKAAYKTRKKEFMATYKEWKAAATGGEVSAEEKERLENQKVEIAKENKALNKEAKEMSVRREDKINATLSDVQKPIFAQMREEQKSKDDEDSDK